MLLFLPEIIIDVFTKIYHLAKMNTTKDTPSTNACFRMLFHIEKAKYKFHKFLYCILLKHIPAHRHTYINTE